MNTNDLLRRVLQNKAITATNAAGLTGKLELPNSDYVPPKDDLWVHFFYKLGGSKQMELGGTKAMERTVGLIQFDLMAPEKSGDGAAVRAADIIRTHFNRKQWLVPPVGQVRMDVASVKTPFGTGAVNGWYRYIVDATFCYDYSDPDALPFDA